MKINKEYIEKYKNYLNEFDYNSKVVRIDELKSTKITNPDDYKELHSLELQIKFLNLRLNTLSDLELNVLGYRFLSNKTYSLRDIAKLTSYSKSTIERIIHNSIAKLVRLENCLDEVI